MNRSDSGGKREYFIGRYVERLLIDDTMGLLLLDEQFRFVEASPSVCESLGGDRESMLGARFDEWCAGMAEPPPIDRGLLKGNTFRNRSFVWRSGDRIRNWMLDGDTLLDDERVVGAYVIFRDVTYLTVLEEQVRRADRLKMIGEVAAGTAHEIRNPLTAIKGFIQLLHKSLSDRKMIRELDYVGIVMTELERVKSLVNEFLLLSKPKEVALLPVRLGHLFREMLPMLRNEATMHGTLLRYEPKPDLPLVYADKEMLKQVFLNLGKNAIEAMEQGGTLTIRERRGDDRSNVLVDVSDTGPGIPKESLERVFDPFFTTKEQGTGLGLSICQRIMHELGGSIRASSGSGGTVFTVAIPIAGSLGEGIAANGGALSPDDV
jgi:signal transduction histidine kinase